MTMLARTPSLHYLNRLVAVGAMIAGMHALANQPTNVTAGEMALLPEYCPDTQGFKYGDASFNTSPRAAHWIRVMGPTFWHQHHYCWGLIKVRRALAPGTPLQAREGGIKSAISDYNYVVNLSPPDFVLLPEVYLRIGEAHVMLNNLGAASEAFAAARRIKPGYWPAYAQWAETLTKLGQKREALALLEECLQITPTEPALLAAYKRMGGNPSVAVRAKPARVTESAASAPN